MIQVQITNWTSGKVAVARKIFWNFRKVKTFFCVPSLTQKIYQFCNFKLSDMFIFNFQPCQVAI